MEAYKKLFSEKHKLNSLVACTLSNPGDDTVRKLCINNSYINPESTDGLHMMSGTYLYTNPPPYGHGSPAPYVAATVNRSYEYNKKTDEDSHIEINGFKTIDTAITGIQDFPKEGISGNFNPSIAWLFSQIFLVKYFHLIVNSAKRVIDFLKSSNSDVLSKGRQTWDPETLKSTTCSKAFNSFLHLLKRNLDKTPSTLLETLIYWYEMYNLTMLTVVYRKKKVVKKTKFVAKLKMRIMFSQSKIYYKTKMIKGREECHKWLDNYARSFCSYIKHAERGKKDRRAIASGSIVMRLHLKVIEEFHLNLAKELPGSTISIGGEEKKKKIVNELQLSTLKENILQAHTLQSTEDATKWNECLNPNLFSLIHMCWFNDNIRTKNNLPLVTDDEKTFERICRIGFYYLLIKRINLGIGFILENDDFYTRLPWCDVKPDMLNPYNRKWFNKIYGEIDDEDYIPASPGFLMGMLNAGSTTIGLVAICGIEIQNTIIRCLRSSDDSMTIFVAQDIKSLANLVALTYSVYRLFGINPSKEKTLLFPEGYGEYTSWYQDGDFVGQYGVETSSLKPGGKNPQDDFNGIAANTLQLMRTNVINVMGAISRITIGINNVKRLWNIHKNKSLPIEISENAIFLSDGGTNPWIVENLAIDEATLRYKESITSNDKKYFHTIMDPKNPFSEPPEESLLYSKDVGVLMSSEETTPRNVFCYIRRSNRTNKDALSKEEAFKEKCNQEAFEIITAIDPSFLLTIPTSKAELNKYLASTILLIREKYTNQIPPQTLNNMDAAIERLIGPSQSYDVEEERSDDLYDII